MFSGMVGVAFFNADERCSSILLPPDLSHGRTKAWAAIARSLTSQST
jgi:hypothetical protein